MTPMPRYGQASGTEDGKKDRVKMVKVNCKVDEMVEWGICAFLIRIYTSDFHTCRETQYFLDPFHLLWRLV